MQDVGHFVFCRRFLVADDDLAVVVGGDGDALAEGKFDKEVAALVVEDVGLEAVGVVGDTAGGEEVGLVFQLSDDIIDITSDVTGKTPGTDLREGVPTLPTLLLADSQDPADQPLKDLLAGDLSDDAALVEALTALRSHPVIERSRAQVRHHASLARQHLGPLPDGEAKQLLLQVCDDLVERSA